MCKTDREGLSACGAAARRGAEVRSGCREGRRSGVLGASGRRAAAPPRARRGTLCSRGGMVRAARRASPLRPPSRGPRSRAARALRGGPAAGAVRCGARRAARAEPSRSALHTDHLRTAPSYREFVRSPSPPSHGALHQLSRSYRFGIRAANASKQYYTIWKPQCFRMGS